MESGCWPLLFRSGADRRFAAKVSGRKDLTKK